MNVIVYGSQYGTAKRYAEELGRLCNIEVKNYKEIDDLDKYEVIVYFGALYAGSVMGLKKTFRKLSTSKDKTIIIATVGLADPNDYENIQNIRDGIRKHLSKETYETAHILHLKGGIDYSNMKLKHKAMMAVAYNKTKNMAEEEKTAEIKAITETYNKNVDYTDFSSLNEIIGLI